VYNAIDPKYIVNTYGATMLRHSNDRPMMAFELIGRLHLRYYNYLTTENAAPYWNYIVNDLSMIGHKRAVVSALMPDAMEKVEFSTSPRYELVIFPDALYDTSLHAIGDILIQTRRVPKESIETRNARYLLDGTEITYEIFNALNPVFIRSLERITDKTEIAQLGYNNCDEVVRINLFTVKEILPPNIVITDGGGDSNKSIAIIDGVPINDDVVEKLYYHFFKEYVFHLPKDDDAYQQYVEKYPGKTDFTIITL
jgi:hypothetical protein